MYFFAFTYRKVNVKSSERSSESMFLLTKDSKTIVNTERKFSAKYIFKLQFEKLY